MQRTWRHYRGCLGKTESPGQGIFRVWGKYEGCKGQGSKFNITWIRDGVITFWSSGGAPDSSFQAPDSWLYMIPFFLAATNAPCLSLA